MKASRNRTIEISAEEQQELREKLLYPKQLTPGQSLTDAIVCGEMTEVLQMLPDEYADLIILDPPYNLTRQFSTTTFKTRSEEAYQEYLESWMQLVCQKLKHTGSLYLCGDWKCTAQLQSTLSKHLTIMNRITWQREKGRGAKNNWKNSMEDIWFAVKDAKNYYFNVEAVKQKRRVLAPYKSEGKPKDWKETSEGNFRLTYPSNFWDDISVPFWSMPENTEHPTQKPEKLIAKIILASTKEGDVVLDPFLGSGTTAAVAQKLKRHFCGIEQEEKYCLLAAKRVALAQTDTSIQGYHDGVFWERNTAMNLKEAACNNSHKSSKQTK